MKVGFRVAERFSAQQAGSWAKYVAWSGLIKVTEVVGLDASLCPSVCGPSIDADWQHLIFGPELGDCFDDLEYLMSRVEALDPRLHQVLAVAREPSPEDIQEGGPRGFRFMGLELVDDSTTSALTNCGGFAEAFETSELSEWALISSAARAYEIRDALASRYPMEPHAKCTVWAVWRQETDWPAAVADLGSRNKSGRAGVEPRQER